jgi:hypothetical protein
MTLDFMTLDARCGLLHGSGLRAARLLGVSVASLLTELLNNDATITTYAREWRCWYVDSLAVLAPESDGSYLMDEVEETGTWQTFFPASCDPMIAPQPSAV